MKIIAALIVCYFWIVNSSAETAFNVYENARFNYQISYPQFLVPQGEPQNGDGQEFRGDNASLTAYGSFFPNLDSQKDEENYNIQDEFNYEIQGIKEKGFVLDYSVLKNDFYVISASNNTTVVYMKKIFNSPCGVHAYFWLYYPKAVEKQWDPMVTTISKSFKYSTQQCQGDYKTTH